MKNPLLENFDLPFEAAPFNSIKNHHFKPAFKQAIAEAKKEIEIICSSEAKPSFENTLEALTFSGAKLDRISSIFFNLNSAETDEEIQKIAQEVSPWLSEFSNDITLNKTLFERIREVHEHASDLDLNEEQKTLLTKNYRNFVRNGALLKEEEKSKLRKIDTELSKLKLQFGENVLAETNNYQLHLTKEEDLKGLPEGAIEAAKMLAKEKELEGWLFTLDYPSYIPFMTYADNRELRKEIALAFGSKSFKENDYNNESLILKLVKLRHERANLLGYKSHAHFVLEERMAENPSNVHTFLNDLLSKSKPAALKEFKELSELASKEGIETLQKWDSAYYSEKLKKARFNLDQEALKPFFKLENVINGVFTIANKLFDLHFEEIDTIDKYHDDVKTYKVTDHNGNYVSLFYADFFPRSGKRNGAWMTSFKGQWKKNGKNSRPHVSIVCNFTKPTNTKPSLLTFNEVTTLFHEFGHALHGMLANTTYPSLSGTNVYWDFVELPSQLMENWCYEEEALKLFATHYETGELIPMDLIAKIKKSSNFLEGLQTVRQLSFGLLDMSWHNESAPTITDVKKHETIAFKPTKLYPDVAENCMSTSFSHIFQGGYSAGYYSYKWAEVLDADAFSHFKKNGIFNKKIATDFKEHILEKGGTENPMDLYLKFRGQKPTNEALLKRSGLI